MEIGCNDGSFLERVMDYTKTTIGVEPSANVGEMARQKGIKIYTEFFGSEFTAIKDLENSVETIYAANCICHIPDINDFTKGLKKLLKRNGTITLEFAQLLKLLQENQFDTVYHEHFSYLSLHTVKTIFEGLGLKIYDVEELTTHGGSLRVFGCHEEAGFETTEQVHEQLQKEKNAEHNNSLIKYLHIIITL